MVFVRAARKQPPYCKNEEGSPLDLDIYLDKHQSWLLIYPDLCQNVIGSSPAHVLSNVCENTVSAFCVILVTNINKKKVNSEYNINILALQKTGSFVLEQ